MTFDFCFAAYNSSKWLNNCVQALAQLNYDKQQIGLYFADNASTDDTIAVLQQLKEQYQTTFSAFEILPQTENKGFGTASNRAAQAGCGEMVVFFNIDTEIFPDALQRLEECISDSDAQWGAFEMRQFPYEHPKYYDPVTMETSWASGAAFAVRRTVLEKTGGFDESIFMYGEDVELSWRIRLAGYKIKYVPAACTWHYAYQTPGEAKPAQIAGSISSNLVLRYKYGTKEQIREWDQLVQRNPETLKILAGVQEPFHKQLQMIKPCKQSYRRFYREQVQPSGFAPTFLGLDYEFARSGAFYPNRLPRTAPRFTVVIRTYQRPDVLALTLENLRNQTYKNFQVIVVEDGEHPQAQQVTQAASQWLDLRYLPLCTQAGRCVAGNTGIQAAETEYVCFLDDDDYLFAEHFEVMACLIEENPNCGLFIAGSVKGSCENAKSVDYRFVKKKNICYTQLSPAYFFKTNPIPIQAAVFRRDLALECGGLDVELDALEDWDLWMRLVCRTSFAVTDKATSIYKVPAESNSFITRRDYIDHYREMVFHKTAQYYCNLPMQDVFRLFWHPDDNRSALEQERYECELRQTARAIYSSRSWKATAPMRLFAWAFYKVMQLILAIPERLFPPCGKIGRTIHTIEQSIRHFAVWVGPSAPEFDTAPIKEIHDFVLDAHMSLCWKLMQKLLKQ